MVSDFDINGPEAWSSGTGSNTAVRVGIIDTGIQSAHEDLSPRVVLGTQFVGPSPQDDNGHGTAVAGIVTASGNNAKGVAGVAWGITPVSIKVLDSSGSGNADRTAQGIDWARQQGIPILNMSLGGGSSAALRDAVHNAFVSGQLLVAAMGNTNNTTPQYPAAYGLPVWAVGALYNNVRWRDQNITECTGQTQGSVFGSWIDISAPGGRGIATTKLGPGTGTYYNCTPCAGDFGGTSAAAPVVAGVAALLKSTYPSLLAEDIQAVMIRSARDVTSSGVGFDNETGYGLVRANAALSLLAAPNALGQHQATGLTTIETFNVTSQIPFIGCPGIPDGNYYGKRYRLRKSITFNKDYVAPPDNWLRNSGTRGTDASNPHIYSEGNDTWAYVVPGTLTSTGCQVETFVYDLTAANSSHVGWYPTTLAAATVAMSTLGPGDATPPAAPSISLSSTCTALQVSWSDTGDDGTSGQAASYELRRSLAPITPANWGLAELMSFGTPGPNGTPHTYDDVVGECSPMMYYAVRLKDNAGNESALGTVNGKTPCLQPPLQCENQLVMTLDDEEGAPTENTFRLVGHFNSVVRGAVEVRLSVPTQSSTSPTLVDVLDLNGRRVQILNVLPVNGHELQATWNLQATDGARVPSGVYYLRAQHAGGQLVRKMLVLR